MGAWGTGAFDNDTAMDLLGEYEQAGVKALHQWMSEWNAVEAFVDADIAAVTIAIGEIVAACRGVPAAGLTDEVLASAMTHHEAVASDGPLLTEVKERVTGDLLDPESSELAELWGEAGGEVDAAFVASVRGLENRLGGLTA